MTRNLKKEFNEAETYRVLTATSDALFRSIETNEVAKVKNGSDIIFATKGLDIVCDDKGNILYSINSNNDLCISEDEKVPRSYEKGYFIANQDFVAYQCTADTVSNLTILIKEKTEFLVDDQGLLFITNGDNSNIYKRILFNPYREYLDFKFVYPKHKMFVGVTAETEQEFQLDQNKKYYGVEAIDFIVLYLQKANLNSIIKKMQEITLIDLGTTKMFPNYNNSSWIMMLNARLPIKGVSNITTKMINGTNHLVLILN